MPSYPCKHPTCSAFVAQRGAYCAQHATTAPAPRAASHAHYDKHFRDRDAKAFYNSRAWLNARRVKLSTNPVCERCEKQWAKHVHHRIPLSRCTLQQRLDQKNLKSLCPPCHNEEEAEMRAIEESCS